MWKGLQTACVLSPCSQYADRMKLTCTHAGPLRQSNAEAIQPDIAVIVDLDDIIDIVQIADYLPECHCLEREPLVNVLQEKQPSGSTCCI